MTPASCHCEQRSDDAISDRLSAHGVTGIAASLRCSQ
jgi:hypothetical protein